MSPVRLVLIATILAATHGHARAEHVVGTFTYDETPATPLSTKPIRGAYVEIWQSGPNWWDQWYSNMSTYTDDAGRIDIWIPWTGPGAKTSLRIYAENRAVEVMVKDHYTAVFFQQPGAWGATVEKSASWWGQEHDFSFRFTDAGAVGYYNVADVILRGREYADARRDYRETDLIGTPKVHISSIGATFYDVGFNVIHIDDGDMLLDDTLLHEYAHMLQNDISSFQPWGAYHDGCTQAFDPPRFAWQEGFAEYFAAVVAVTSPGIDGGNVSAPETPSCANGPGSVNLELFVASALFDLIDTSTGEQGDQLCNTQHAGYPNDRRIFEIFDHELEIGPNNPRLVDFTHAWIRRGYDVPFGAFGAISSGLTVPTPVTARYDFDTVTANKAIFRPSTAQWWILNSAHPFVDAWGDQPGDVPVPADYDGDGITDIGIWRPSDGMWWVIHSSTNSMPYPFTPVQWGTNGDIPVPGDYDGDGEDDFAVYRPGDSRLYIYGDGCALSTIHTGIQVASGSPVVGDYDNDGRDDLGVHQGDGWFVVRRSNGTGNMSTYLGQTVFFGNWFFVIWTQPIVGDFDGDGVADMGRFEYGQAAWRIRLSSTGVVATFFFGNPWDVPVPADYDGDGITDRATWTPDGGGGLAFFHVEGAPDQQWGFPGDIPVPAP